MVGKLRDKKKRALKSKKFWTYPGILIGILVILFLLNAEVTGNTIRKLIPSQKTSPYTTASSSPYASPSPTASSSPYASPSPTSSPSSEVSCKSTDGDNPFVAGCTILYSKPDCPIDSETERIGDLMFGEGAIEETFCQTDGERCGSLVCCRSYDKRVMNCQIKCKEKCQAEQWKNPSTGALVDCESGVDSSVKTIPNACGGRDSSKCVCKITVV